MNRLLNALGLMTRAEHELEMDAEKRNLSRARENLATADKTIGTLYNERYEFEAKYKKAITDLAAARDEVEALSKKLANAEFANESLRPDALAMRRKRAMDRDRKKGKV